MNDLILIGMGNGQLIMGALESNDDSVLRVKKPHIVHLQLGQDGTGKVSLIPFLKSISKDVITVKESNISFLVEKEDLDPNFVDLYLKQASGLVFTNRMPPAPNHR